MIYSKFLKPGDTIGICAPSSGIEEDDISYDIALNNLKKEGYNIIETPNVRTGKTPSSDAKIRAKEFNELMQNDDIDFIYSASGGDLLIEVLPFIDDEIIKDKISKGETKWFAGYSDPTSLLYYLTTKYDIATLYGTNAGSFDQNNLHISLENALKFLKGDIVEQESFGVCERISWDEKKANVGNGYILNTDSKWINLNGDVDIKGRLIGGCIDCLQFLIGTKFDYTNEFIEKYKNDGFIWYFDNFALKSEDLFYVLWSMKEAGWFKFAKGFVFGRTLIEGTMLDLSYEDVVRRALGNEVPIIMEADIGHVKPTFTLINGSIAHFKSKDGKGSLEIELS